MFQTAKDVLKELLIFLAMVQVVYFLIPRSLKMIIKGIAKCLGRGLKGITRYAKSHIYYLNKEKKVTPVQMEQPSNVIKVIYPNHKVKKYYKVN
ncbi:hypothetical protein [Clostridium sulfidigenes]|uniref:hypothetical protein n=1 Tax=Clostridium sulfidigenes TaxID=318464 RepID=UPI003F8C7698